MNFFNRHQSPLIEVELKIIGFFLYEYVNIVTRINIKAGGSPSDVVRAASDSGELPERLSYYLNKYRRDLTLLLNGEPLRSGRFRKGCLKNYDSMLIFFPLSGG